MNIIGDVKGKDCYMIDDMMDTGRSAVIGATALRKEGAKTVRIAAIHAVLSDPCYDLLKDKPFDEVIVTDSIPLPARFREFSFIHVVSLASMLAECIERIVNNAPLSAVYSAYADPENVKLN
jgi:ribose-phosphate pyrophosphokinase